MSYYQLLELTYTVHHAAICISPQLCLLWCSHILLCFGSVHLQTFDFHARFLFYNLLTQFTSAICLQLMAV